MSSGEDWENPIADAQPFEVEPQRPANAKMMIGNQSDLSEEELVDLTYAFQAADISQEGRLNCEEFHFMLEIMGCELDQEQSRKLMTDAKAGFATWLKTTDDSSRDQCRKVWDTFDTNHDGRMDYKEISGVIGELKKQGLTPSALSEESLGVKGWNFDEFCTCV